jgi:hypothetical protein
VFKLGKLYRFNDADVWWGPFKPGEMSMCVEVFDDADKYAIPLCKLMTINGPYLLISAYSRHFTEVT